MCALPLLRRHELWSYKGLDLPSPSREAVARQAVQRVIMNVVSVRSQDQLADIMCKQADKGYFEAMRNAVLGMSTAIIRTAHITRMSLYCHPRTQGTIRV